MKHSLSSHKEMNVQLARLLDAIVTCAHKSECTLDYSCIHAHITGSV